MFDWLREKLTKLFGGAFVAPLTIDGRVILDANGDAFMPRGYCLGGDLMIREPDFQKMADDGANSVRMNVRVWGWYTGAKFDAQQVEAPGHLKPERVEELVRLCKAAKKAKLRVILAFDSNCGQGFGYQDEMCGGFDFGSPEVQETQWKWYVEMIEWLTYRLRGLVDFIEPIVEPRFKDKDQEFTWLVQEMIMLRVMKKLPEMLFIIGAYPTYWLANVPMAYKAAWALPDSPFKNKIVMTGNMLEDLVMNVARGNQRLRVAVEAAVNKNFPLFINQVGCSVEVDTGSLKLVETLKSLNALRVGYTIWDWVTAYPSFGVEFLTNPKDFDSPRIVNEDRKAKLSTCLRE